MTARKVIWLTILVLIAGLTGCFKNEVKTKQSDTEILQHSSPNSAEKAKAEIKTLPNESGSLESHDIVARVGQQTEVDFQDYGIPDSPYIINRKATSRSLIPPYTYVKPNHFIDTNYFPQMTYNLEIDSTSYRRFCEASRRNWPIDPRSIRLEEMVNAFKYAFPFPKDDPVSIYTEMAECLWNDNHHLIMVCLETVNPMLSITDLPPSNLVFLIDVSRSMSTPGKLPVLKVGLKKLAEQLRPNDRVSIVTYSSRHQILAEGISGKEKAKLESVIDQLSSGSPGMGIFGLYTAYEIAQRNFVPGGNNHVIMITDVDFYILNPSSESELISFIETEKNTGVNFSIIGFDLNQRVQSQIKKISTYGNGRGFFVNSQREATGALLSGFQSKIHPLFEDMRIQLEFNPEQIASYRLLGYQNRASNDDTLEQDWSQMSEMMFGQQAVALIEVTLSDGADLRSDSELLNISAEYRDPLTGQSEYLDHVLTHFALNKPADNLAIASSLAALGLYLKDDPRVRKDILSEIKINLEPHLDNAEMNELYQLIEKLEK